LINDAQELITNHQQKVMERKTTQWSEIKNENTDTLAPFLYKKTKRRPMTLPIIMEV
ncbi:ribonuclease J, partial [Bacillus spizizenii]|nr:ribonuclease J [Bacillus spizizenii]